MRDKLWFFGTARVLGVDKTVTDTFYDGDSDPMGPRQSGSTRVR